GISGCPANHFRKAKAAILAADRGSLGNCATSSLVFYDKSGRDYGQEGGMQDSDKIVLFGLDEDDADLLLPNVPASDQSREPQDLKSGHKGEPATALVAIAVTAAALKAWVAFMTLQGQKRKVAYKFQIRKANGDTQNGEIIISES